jgi:hypothetical protein
MLSPRCSSDFVAGIGTITGERRSSQARATADVETDWRALPEPATFVILRVAVVAVVGGGPAGDATSGVRPYA